MNIEDDNGTPVQRITTEYKPPKSWQSRMIGRPLQTADAPHQTIGKLIGLAVFSSDAMSSVAYGPQEMMLILALAGKDAFGLSFPLAIAIVILLAILTISYEQTIHAYPGGGGAYIVARDNLGEKPALLAASSLLTDYILTVAVSISSGVAQIVSAVPDLFPWKAWIAVVLVLFVMVVNLRGVKESGKAFAIPTYFFIVMMYVTVGIGLLRVILGTLGNVQIPPEMETTTQSLTFFLVLRAFSNGTSALTGVEAISNGITAFKPPRSKNAGITLIWMAIILGSLMLGITFLSQHIHAIPAESETVISQLARTVYDGRGFFYLMTILATMVILVLAANTAFADFPRLGAMVAQDGFLPRQLTYRGSRLVYSRGIMLLSAVACALILLFQASVTALIPLYAIGVFMSFTLSQSGMAHRWWKSGHTKRGEEIKERGSTLKYENRWGVKMIVNGVGALCTAVVTIVFAVTKFTEGAWIIILVIPIMMGTFMAIHRHYSKLANNLSLEHFGAPSNIIRHRVILLVGGVHRGSLAALRYARTLSDDITAVHVSIDPDETDKLQKKWETWGDGIRLVILDSQYRLFVEPVMGYIEEIAGQSRANEIITVVVPQFVSGKIWTSALHARTADTLRRVLLNRKNIVITEVPYLVN
jgi:amino acid transporter